MQAARCSEALPQNDGAALAATLSAYVGADGGGTGAATKEPQGAPQAHRRRSRRLCQAFMRKRVGESCCFDRAEPAFIKASSAWGVRLQA